MSTAVAHKSQPLLDSGALPVLLRHHHLLSDAGAVCQLLKTSKAMRAAVLQHCHGLISVDIRFQNEQHVDQFLRWLSSNACLLGLLVLEPLAEFNEALERHASECLIQTLQQYSLKQGKVPLNSFASQHAVKQAGALLQTMSACSLVNLVLHGNYNGDKLRISGSDLSGFSSLRTLSLHWFDTTEAETLTKAVSGLTHLQHLELEVQWDAEGFMQLQQRLPSSLLGLTLLTFSVDLGLNNLPTPLPVQYQLQHLQQLTQLHVIEMLDGSCLPQQLQELRCADCHGMQILLPCSQLQMLDITESSTSSAANWQQLAELTSLTSIDLVLVDSAINATAPAFALKPLSSALQALEISHKEDAPIEAATLQSLRWLTALTSLRLTVIMPLPGSPADFGAILQQLTALQQVEIATAQNFYFFESVLQPLPAPPVGTRQAIQQLAAYWESDQTGAEAMETLSVLPSLEQIVLQIIQDGIDDTWGAVEAAVVENPMAVHDLHDFVKQMHESPLQHPETLRPQELQPLVEAIAGLPLLNSLKLKGAGLDESAVDPLTGVTQLTRLTMSGQDFDDLALVKLVYALTNLRRLSLSDSREITDASLLVVGKALLQLTELELTNCHMVTDSGIAQLTGLRHLQLLEAFDAPYVRPSEVDRVMRVIAAQERTRS